MKSREKLNSSRYTCGRTTPSIARRRSSGVWGRPAIPGLEVTSLIPARRRVCYVDASSVSRSRLVSSLSITMGTPGYVLSLIQLAVSSAAVRFTATLLIRYYGVYGAIASSIAGGSWGWWWPGG